MTLRKQRNGLCAGLRRWALCESAAESRSRVGRFGSPQMFEQRPGANHANAAVPTPNQIADDRRRERVSSARHREVVEVTARQTGQGAAGTSAGETNKGGHYGVHPKSSMGLRRSVSFQERGCGGRLGAEAYNLIYEPVLSG